MRIDRMLAIVIMLLNKDRVSARELSNKFEVSIRTVYRDIDAINLAGIPIVSFSGNNGGFGILDNYKLDRQLLSLDDMLSILTALKGINNTLEDKYLTNAIDKITSLVPKEKADELNQHFENVIIDLLPWTFNDEQKKILKMIHDAIKENIIIQFDYKNLKSEKITRMVEPMSLVFKGYSWYLFGFCGNKKDYRIFKLSRIGNLLITEKIFKRRNYSYRDFFIEDKKAQNLINIKLRFSPEVKDIVEEYYGDDKINIDDDGYLIVELNMPEDRWIYSNILSFGEHVEVLSPLYLREIIKDKAKKITEKY